MDDPSFFKNGVLNDIFVGETCEQLLDRQKKASDENKQKAVSAAVVVNNFVEQIDPNDYPTLNAKKICLKTDKDITSVLRDIIKLSKKVKSVDLLKVLNYNDATTSLVEVPCSLGSNRASRSKRDGLDGSIESYNVYVSTAEKRWR